MRVVVKVHRTAQAAFEAWRSLLAAPPLGSDDLARVHVQALFDELIRSDGRPHEAVVDPTVSPTVLEWVYSSETVVRYIVRDKPGRWWFHPPVRTVLIIGVEQTPRA